MRHNRTNSNQKILLPGFVDCKLIWVKHENMNSSIFDRVNTDAGQRANEVGNKVL